MCNSLSTLLAALFFFSASLLQLGCTQKVTQGNAAVIFMGNNQTAVVGTQANTPLAVRVTDGTGKAVPYLPVQWNIAQGEGFLSGLLIATDITGVAQTTLNVGTNPGVTTVTATPLGGSPLTFTTTAVARGTLNFSNSRGNFQTALVKTPLATPFIVTARDKYGLAVPNLTVIWNVTSGGGTLNGGTSLTTTTDVSGHAQATLVLGQNASVSNQVTATLDGVSDSVGSPVTFEAYGLPQAIYSITIDSSSLSQVQADSTHTVVAHAVDLYNNSVPSARVNWTVSTPDFGTFTNPSVVTDSNGNSINSLTVGNIIGSNYSLTATFGSTSYTVTPIQVVSSGGGSLQKSDGDAQIGIVREALTRSLKVQLLDAQNHPLSGVSVAWAVASGGGTLSQAAQVTDQNGSATASYTLGPTAGTNHVTASASGLSVTFLETATSGVVSSLQLATISNNYQIAFPGTTLFPFRVLATDAYQNPVPGATVNWTLPPNNLPGTSFSNITPTGPDGISTATLSLPSNPLTTTYSYASISSGTSNLQVQFTAVSTGTPTKYSTPGSHSFNVSGSSHLRVVLIGGGGGASGTDGTVGTPTLESGGGGGYVEVLLSNVSTHLNFVVGDSGTAGTNEAGGAGGNSTVSDLAGNILASAMGGTGGLYSQASASQLGNASGGAGFYYPSTSSSVGVRLVNQFLGGDGVQWPDKSSRLGGGGAGASGNGFSGDGSGHHFLAGTATSPNGQSNSSFLETNTTAFPSLEGGGGGMGESGQGGKGGFPGGGGGVFSATGGTGVGGSGAVIVAPYQL